MEKMEKRRGKFRFGNSIHFA